MPGIRYRESDERRLKSGRPDRYYAIRYSVNGKQREEGLGWASEGWNTDKAQGVLAKLKEGSRTGDGARTLAELREENLKRRQAEQLTAQEMTVAQFFDQHYLPAAQKRKRTWSHDAGRFNKTIRSLLGDYPLAAINSDHIEELLKTVRKAGASEATALQYAAVMRQIFNLARVTFVGGKSLYAEPHSPLDSVRLPKAVVERERFLTYEEADALISAAKGLSPDLADMVVLGLNTGLRFGELLRLEWTDVSLAHATLVVRQEDMRKPGGRVPLNEHALAALRGRAAHRKKGVHRVFPEEITGKDGFPLRRLFAEAVETCELNSDSTSARDRVVFHTLRHTFASWLAISGRADIYRIKTLMRHKTIKMTERYAHLLPDATRDAVNHLRPQSDL